MRDLIGKRFASCLLAVAMIVSLSSNALADEAPAAEQEAAPIQTEMGGTYQIGTDTEPNVSVQVPTAITDDPPQTPLQPAAQETLMLGATPVAAADSKPILYQNGFHYIEDNGIIMLYCMNNKLTYPHDTAQSGDEKVPEYTEGYLTHDDFDSPAQYEEFVRRVTNLLYAGYPHNGANLYKIVTDEDLRVPTEDEFNEMLIPPAQLAEDFTYLKHYEFAYPAESEELSILSRFVREIGAMSESDKTNGGLTKSAIQSVPFYKAALCMTTGGSSEPRALFGNYYGANYFVTEEQAYGATQNALWKLLHDYGVEDNGISSLSGVRLADELMKFSEQGYILHKQPELKQLKLEGNFHFSYNPKDGLWHSEPLKLVEPKDYSGIYHLTLPEGVRTMHSISYVYGNEEYELISDHLIQSGETFGFDAEFTWLKAFKQYSPTLDIQVNGKRFQRMAGSVLETTTLRGALTHTTAEEGSLSVTKTVVGGDDTRSFTFALYLPDTPLNGTYGDVDFGDGIAYFDLKHGETKQVLHLPAGTVYRLREIGDGSFDVKSENADGVIVKDQTIQAVFTNTPLPNLTISKVVTGTDGDPLHRFTFTIELRDAKGDPLNGTYECYGSVAAGFEKDKIDAPKDFDLHFADGKAQLQLSHGQQLTIKGLPYQSTYTVTEEDANGYTVTYNGANSPAVGTLVKAESVQVRNEKKAEPPTTLPASSGRPHFGGILIPTDGDGGEKPTAPNPPRSLSPAPREPEPVLPEQSPVSSEPEEVGLPEAQEPVPSETHLIDFGVPQTGDATGISLWLTLLCISFAGMIAAAAMTLRKKRENDAGRR